MASNNSVENPLVIVYTFDQTTNVYSFSPFAIKLRFRLRHAGIPYKDEMGSMGAAPKKKIPYVKFTDTDELMGDSALIIERLVAEGKMPKLNDNLPAADAATDLCIRSMLEDRLYYLALYERWRMAYTAMRDHGPFAHQSWGIRHIICSLVSKYIGLILYFQGVGRYTKAEVEGFIRESILALNGFVAEALVKAKKGSKEPFWILGGSQATEADFTLFGVLVGLLARLVNPLHASLIKEQSALVEYVTRIHEKYFSDMKCPI